MSEHYAIVWNGDQFTHGDACRVYDAAQRAMARTIVLDLSCARDATTSAFARLVLLRRFLLRTGRDLRLIGLSDRAARLFEVSRLGEVLPCERPAVRRREKMSPTCDFLPSAAAVR